MDAVDPSTADEQVAPLQRRAADLQLPFFRISGATGAGVPELLEAMWRRLAAARQSAA
jgi:hypothetical protein